MSTALLLVDVQRNMLVGAEPVPAATNVAAALGELLARARAAEAVIVQVQHDGHSGTPDEVGTDGWELFFPPEAGDIVLHKDIGDAFVANPDLATTLRDRGVERVVVAGMQSEFCIDAASRSALDLGFSVVLASGAHATYDDGAPAAELSTGAETALAAHGIHVVPAADVLF